METESERSSSSRGGAKRAVADLSSGQETEKAPTHSLPGTQGQEKKKIKPEKVFLSHPYGVRPLGNLLVDAGRPGFIDRRALGLGALAALEDHLLYTIFEELSAEDLARVSRVSKAFYVLAHEDDLWKLLCLERFGGEQCQQMGEYCEPEDGKEEDQEQAKEEGEAGEGQRPGKGRRREGAEGPVRWRFEGTWRRTYAAAATGRAPPAHRPLDCTGLYSDYLYDIWREVSADLSQWTRGPETIDRRAGLTLQQFTDEYFIPNRPVILTDIVPHWPAFTRWQRAELLATRGDQDFYINTGLRMRLADYFSYADQQRDEMPAYLFDHTFGERHPDMLQEFTVPEYFREDFFALLGEAGRPNYRWLLAGPARSGATFHLDPNHTSAWNGVISGAKKWVMYPPHVTPPGVYPSEDGMQVQAPLSIVDWFLHYYEGTGGVVFH